MKSIVLLIIFACIGFQSFSQYARSVYSDDSPARRHTSLFSFNGETTVTSIRESSNDTLRVMLIDIDQNGETDNYRMFEYSPLDLSGSFALSGVGVNSAGEITVCIIKESQTSTSDIHYVKLDPSSGTFSEQLSLNGTYEKGFSRSRQKGDSLITYFANAGGSGIERIARSLNNSAVSTELALANESYSGNVISNQIACELIIDGSAEYAATSDRIIRRSSANTYLETGSIGFFSALRPCILPSGELLIINLYNGDCNTYDASLNLLNSVNVPELQGAPDGIAEVYPLANNGIRVWQRLSNASTVIDLNPSFTISSIRKVRCEPFDQLKLDGKQYVVGVDKNFSSQNEDSGIPFAWNASSISIVQDDLSNDIPEFIDYDQVLTSGNIEFHTNHVSRSFTNSESGLHGFSFEQNGIHRAMIHSASENILGSTINGNLVGSTHQYPPSQVTGPYTAPGSYSLEIMDKYNRGYYVTRDMIEMHLFEISNGNPNYEIPFGIREWPAHGDVSLGQAANLASFIDQNSNGTYEPELGDYPAIFGDQCVLNIYHQHPNSPNSASIETHQYYFTFDCDTSETLENTVFVRTDNFARSQAIYDSYEGNYVDFEVGSPFDDYIGTNVELGMTYSYNGDQFDENSGPAIGFQDTIPAIGMIALQGMKLDDDGTDNFTTPAGGAIESNGIGFNDGIVDNEYYTMESSFAYAFWPGPATLTDWSEVMMGLNPDGSPKTANGVDIRHDYFGSSDPNFYTSGGTDHGNNYSEESLSNPSGDRRMVSASGPSTFPTTDTVVLLKAFVVGVDATNISVDNSVQRLFEHGQNLRDYFDQNATPCGNSFDNFVSSSVLGIEEEEIQQILAYPNPAKEQIQFRGIAGSASITIFDLNGRAVVSEPAISDDQVIDISPLEKSIYIIQISDENGSQTIRMVKH